MLEEKSDISCLQNTNASDPRVEQATHNEASVFSKEKEVSSPLQHLLSLQWKTTAVPKFTKQMKRVRFTNHSVDDSIFQTSHVTHEEILSDILVDVNKTCAYKHSNFKRAVQDYTNDYDDTETMMELVAQDNSTNDDLYSSVVMKCKKLNLNSSNCNCTTGKSVNCIEGTNENCAKSCEYFHNQRNVLQDQQISNHMILVRDKDESELINDAVPLLDEKQDYEQSIDFNENSTEDAVIREHCHYKVSDEKFSKNALRKRSNRAFSGAKQSFKLNSLLKKEDVKPCSAIEIKSAIFKAWCKLKKEANKSKNLGAGLDKSDKDAALDKYEIQHLNYFSNLNDDTVKHMKIPKKENLAVNKKFPAVSFQTGSNIGKQSCKLNSLLRDDNVNVYNAFELKSTVFDAWCKVKNDEFRAKNTAESAVDKQKEMTEKSVSYGTRKLSKIKVERKKKKHEVVLNSVVQHSMVKTDDDESKMAFRSWKKKKDELLKAQVIEKNEDEMKKQMDALMAEEIRKQDARCAYVSWQTHKSHDMKMEKRMKEWLTQKETEKVDFKHKRDEEALKRYYIWLKNKYSFRTNLCRVIKNKPPWFPPGKS